MSDGIPHHKIRQPRTGAESDKGRSAEDRRGESLEEIKWWLHEKECETAAMAVLKERKRLRPTYGR